MYFGKIAARLIRLSPCRACCAEVCSLGVCRRSSRSKQRLLLLRVKIFIVGKTSRALGLEVNAMDKADLGQGLARGSHMELCQLSIF